VTLRCQTQVIDVQVCNQSRRQRVTSPATTTNPRKRRQIALELDRSMTVATSSRLWEQLQHQQQHVRTASIIIHHHWTFTGQLDDFHYLIHQHQQSLMTAHDFSFPLHRDRRISANAHQLAILTRCLYVYRIYKNKEFSSNNRSYCVRHTV